MTYQEANELREIHIEIVGRPSALATIPYYIRGILIAPRNRSEKDVKTIYVENTRKPIDNEMALNNLGYLNEDLDLFVVWEEKDEITIMLLDDYKRQAGL